MTILFSDKFPLQELKRLHGDLDQLEIYLQIDKGGWYKARDEIDLVYQVQEIIEKLVFEEKLREKEDNINNLDLDF